MNMLLKYILTSIIVMIMANNIIAQFVSPILTLLPSNPSSTDVLRVACYTQFGGTPCALSSSTVTGSNFQIAVLAYHNMGVASGICYSKNTITLGSFAAGIYKLVYTIRHTITNNQMGKDSLNFTIAGPNGVKEMEILQNLKLYPNPVKDVLMIESAQLSLTENLEFKLFNLVGQEVISAKIKEDTKQAINLKDLSAGIYFIRFNYKGQSITKKIIKE